MPCIFRAEQYRKKTIQMDMVYTLTKQHKDRNLRKARRVTNNTEIMAEIVATSLLKFVSDQLATKALSEFALLTGADKELRKLERTLSTIQDVLEDAETRQVKERALRSWLRKLKDLAYEADDVLDDFATKAMKLKPGIEADMKEKVRTFLSIPKNIAFRRKISLRVKEINHKLDEVAEERSKFHLKEGSLMGNSSKLESGLVREGTGSFITESEVYGREEDKEKIVSLLLKPFTHGSEIGVVSIVGLGGLGKTTLAQLVYNDERVRDRFEKQMWVCVSDEFEIRRLIGLIMESVTGSEFSPTNMDTMQLSLAKQLQGKRFLLVLDDVWSESQEKWDKLRTLLAVGGKGSQILVTTRSERVASIMGTVSPYRLLNLTLNDCWLVFERRAFAMGVERNSNLIEIGREIVKKCGGVPLAAKALGSLLRFKRTESGWLAVKDSELWKLSGDENYEILPALKLSYDHLSSFLKQCFTYCSIFPKDYEIDVNILVNLWHAEGFLKPSDGQMDLQQIGLQYVDELLERSLFQKSMDEGGVVREIKMHDLIHDLARSIAGDECSIVDPSSSNKTLSQNSRYASFICNEKPLSASLQSLYDAKKLRTLYLHAKAAENKEEEKRVNEVLDSIASNVNLLRALRLTRYPLKSLPDSFKKLKHLRYLDLSNTSLDSFPPCISTLQNLKTLNLSSTNIESIPDSIGNLCNLSTLDLRYCSHLSSLPSSIGQLKSLLEIDLSRSRIKSLPESICVLSNLHTLTLRDCYFIHELPQNICNINRLIHLDIHGTQLICLPRRLGKLSQLQTLPIFIRGGEEDCSLAELGSLKLEGELRIKALQRVTSVDEVKAAHLNEKRGIRVLSLSWEFNQKEFDCVNIYQAEDVLQNLQPHNNLKELEIQCYVGRCFPHWIMNLSLSNLARLTLSCCMCEKLPALGQLPQLEYLNLAVLPLIKQLGSDFYGGPNSFPLLKELGLNDMTELEEWCNVGEEQFLPCLHKLSLFDCPKLKELPSNFPLVTTLKMNVDDKLLLSSLQNGAFPNLKEITMQNFDEEEDQMPEILTERAESLARWSLGSKPKPKEDDSTIMSSSCICMSPIHCLALLCSLGLPQHDQLLQCFFATASSLELELSFLAEFSQVMFHHIPREANRLADFCAKLGISCSFIWQEFELAPPEFLEIVQDDLASMIPL
ncbi:putative disease resistance protein RGA3 [Platanthera zijinensis]|uniref:Disease resistance protein RGA3 n=1 Tax=Platanthera zijinensis TaxID=2320716 RepID=A0AAP0B667_9ASPA